MQDAFDEYNEAMKKVDFQYLFKGVFVGPGRIGKTKFLRRFADPQNNVEPNHTIGVEFIVRKVKLDDTVVKLQVWDLQGSPPPNMVKLTDSYYRGMYFVGICFDLSSRQSFNEITAELQKALSLTGEKAVYAIIGLKSDLADRREISYEEAKALADSLGFPYFETSAESGVNVELVMETLAKNTLLKYKQGLL